MAQLFLGGDERNIWTSDDDIVLALDVAIDIALRRHQVVVLVSEYPGADGVETRLFPVAQAVRHWTDVDESKTPLDSELAQQFVDAARSNDGWIFIGSDDDVVTDPDRIADMKSRAR